jgi:hypothetical protein
VLESRGSILVLALALLPGGCGTGTHTGRHYGPHVDLTRRQVCPLPEELQARLAKEPQGKYPVKSVDRFVRMSYERPAPVCKYPVVYADSSCKHPAELELRLPGFDPTEPKSFVCPPPSDELGKRLTRPYTTTSSQCESYRITGPGRLVATGTCIYDVTYEGKPPPPPPWLTLH